MRDTAPSARRRPIACHRPGEQSQSSARRGQSAVVAIALPAHSKRSPAIRASAPGLDLGSQNFKDPLVERIEGKLGDHPAGESRQERTQAKAEPIVEEELQQLGCYHFSSVYPAEH